MRPFKSKIIGNNMGLQKFLGAVLEMKADLIEILFLFCKNHLGEFKVIFSFGDPFVDYQTVNHEGRCLP